MVVAAAVAAVVGAGDVVEAVAGADAGVFPDVPVAVPADVPAAVPDDVPDDAPAVADVVAPDPVDPASVVVPAADDPADEASVADPDDPAAIVPVAAASSGVAAKSVMCVAKRNVPVIRTTITAETAIACTGIRMLCTLTFFLGQTSTHFMQPMHSPLLTISMSLNGMPIAQFFVQI